jgi:ATP-dependent exoDNAse (exonuclease V) beta subunit
MSTILENDQDLALDLPKYTVVSASAGSGKTTALKQRFVQLLLSKSIPANGLKNILAITFTNNAAREMKRRILDSLKLASLDEPKTVAEIGGLLSLSPSELQLEATWQVDEILDNYSDFQVQTIDSFLSRVFKVSALELGLSPDFEIVLDSEAILDDAFAQFARELSEGSSSTYLFNDLLRLLLESRGSDERFLWNPYPELAEKVKDLYTRVTLRSQSLRRENFSSRIKKSSDEIVHRIRRLDVLLTSPDLERGKRFEDYVKHAKAHNIDRLTEVTFPSPLTKSGSDPKAYDRAVTKTKALFGEIEELRKELIHFKARHHYQPYAEALTLFRESIDRVKREQGRIDIGDVVKRLAEYLKPGTVPEIYYSLGDTIRHYLIDEFQDTNPIQWDNLEPLIGNALAVKASLFVVGDTKQSIYGFRGADWKIMKRLIDEDVFPSATKDLKYLTVNFRSFERILTFNKTVFQTIVPTKVIPRAASASGLSTDTPVPKEEFKNKGYVELVSIPADAEPDVAGQSPEQQKLLAIVEDCLARGYRKSDITILSPRNGDVIEVSGWLNQQHLDFVSHSSLDVRTRAITRELLALLRFLESPIDNLSFASVLLSDMFTRLLDANHAAVHGNDLREFLFAHQKALSRARPLYVGFREAYPDLWQQCFEDLFNVVGYLPVYDFLCEVYNAMKIFSLFPDEEATLVKMLEAVKDFEGTGENSLKGFLDYAEASSEDADWDIDIPTDIDAVKVMTVHKAKGLQSKVVIVLLYDSRRRYDGLYFQEDGDELRLVRLTKKEEENVGELAELYEEKTVAQTVDDLNKLYVALTRAEEEMYVISVKAERTKTPSEFFPEHGYESRQKPAVVRPAISRKSSVQLSHEFLHAPLRPTEYAGIALQETRRGDFFHAALEQIYTLDDSMDQQIAEALRYARKLSIYQADIQQSKVLLLTALQNPDARPLFVKTEGRMILNEQEFATRDGALLRMDRVVVDTDRVTVIDYKTGDEKPGYTEQITLYINVLRGFYRDRTVEGLILYIDRNICRRY